MFETLGIDGLWFPCFEKIIFFQGENLNAFFLNVIDLIVFNMNHITQEIVNIKYNILETQLCNRRTYKE